jgi:glucosyl-dolichyl phosphate glucuronosyltransferase
MRVTAIICTYNRCQSLANALESLAASTLPEATEWEVLVVDNNSNDRTREVVESSCHRYPNRFRYIFEPLQGKSHALNTGIREARGEVLAFTDDDVIVEPTWLHNLTSVLHDREWAGSGGRILPASSFVPPSWLALSGPLSLVGALCAYCDPGNVPGELKSPPIGANMAFRKEMFDKYGHFRTDLGPRPGSEMRCEDTELGRRLMAFGERFRYEPSATVYHEIHENRVRKEFFLGWWFEFGRGSVRETGACLGPKEMVKVAMRALLNTQRWLLSVDSKVRFYRKCRTWFEVGKIVELFYQTRKSRPTAKSEVAGAGTA